MKIAKMMMASGVAWAVLSLSAAVETVNGYQWTYRIIDGMAEIYNGGNAAIASVISADLPPAGVVEIPSYLGGKRVGSIGDYAFSGCDEITGVTIPSGVKIIGFRAFEACSSLKRVTIPYTVKTICEYVFTSCNGLETVSLPSELKEIRDGVFCLCSMLKDVKIPETVTSIGEYAFYKCHALMCVTIPASVKSIGKEAFAYGDNLKRVYFDGSAPAMGTGVFSGVPGDCIAYAYRNPESWGGDLPCVWNGRRLYYAAIPPGVDYETPLGLLGFETPVDGSTYTITVKGLPAGLKYDAKKGKITGKATKPGYYDVAIAAKSPTNKTGVADTLKLFVENYTDGAIPIEDSYGPFVPGQECCEWIDAAVGCSVAGLPAGMKWTAKDIMHKGSKTDVEFSANSAYGTPTKPGSYTVTFTKTVNKVKHTATATFVVSDLPKLFIEKSGSGSGKVTGEGAYAAHKKVSLKATADKGSVFAGWYQDDYCYSKAASFSYNQGTDDTTLVARFVTLEEDAAFISAELGAFNYDSGTLVHETSVPAGVFLNWPLNVDTRSLASVKFTGLPAGLKYTTKDIFKNGVWVFASSIYGTPTAAKTTDLGMEITTAGKAKKGFVLRLTVTPMHEWAIGTFDGGGGVGQMTLTVKAGGKISGKYLIGGKTWTLSADSFSELDESEGRYTAMLAAKAGKETKTYWLNVFDSETGGQAELREIVGELSVKECDLYKTNWKVDPWKDVGKAFDKKESSYDVSDVDGNPGTITLKMASSGKVAVKGVFVIGKDAKGKDVKYTASGSAMVCPTSLPDEGTGAFNADIFICLPPTSGKFGGYCDAHSLYWNGTAFE